MKTIMNLSNCGVLLFCKKIKHTVRMKKKKKKKKKVIISVKIDRFILCVDDRDCICFMSREAIGPCKLLL